MKGIEWILARRSIRSYTPDPIPVATVKTLLEAAMAAPSASNRQPWEFVAVRDPGLREQLSGTSAWTGMVAHAPLCIVVCGHPNDSRHWVEDCSAAAQNILLGATSLGLGSVWLGLYPAEERLRAVRKILGLPDDVSPLCMIAIGFPTEAKPPHTKYDPAKVHFDRFKSS